MAHQFATIVLVSVKVFERRGNQQRCNNLVVITSLHIGVAQYFASAH
jgi:hypothetical protein